MIISLLAELKTNDVDKNCILVNAFNRNWNGNNFCYFVQNFILFINYKLNFA